MKSPTEIAETWGDIMARRRLQETIDRAKASKARVREIRRESDMRLVEAK